VAAGGAQIVRATQLAAIRALLECRDAQRIVRTTHATPRRRSLSLWDGHVGKPSNVWIFKTRPHDRPSTDGASEAGIEPAARRAVYGQHAKRRRAYTDFPQRCNPIRGVTG
jgi:hypothetical protein